MMVMVRNRLIKSLNWQMMQSNREMELQDPFEDFFEFMKEFQAK